MPKYTQVVTTQPLTERLESGEMEPFGTTYIETALGDTSDTTYGRALLTSLPMDFGADWPELAAGERIVSACPWARIKQPDGSTKNSSVAVGLAYQDEEGGGAYLFEGVKLTIPALQTTITDYEVAAQNGQRLTPDGRQWNDGQYLWASAPSLTFRDPHGSSATRTLWYKAGVNLYATKAATIATPSAPSGTITNTQRPTLAATVSSIVESWQVPSGLSPFMCGLFVEYRLYAGSLTTPSGTPLFTMVVPATISAYGDGVTPSTLSVQATPSTLIPNGNWTLFARVSREHPSGVMAWSGYQYRQFTVNVANPTTPALTLSPDSTNQRVGVTVNATATTGYDSSTCQVHVQRQVAGVWRDVRGMVEIAHTVGSAILVGYDYEADRGVSNSYRARVSMWHTADAVRRYSAWDTEAASGPAVTAWNLKTVEAPASNWLGVPVEPDPSESSQAPSAILEPLDRDRPVVLLGSIGGMAGALAVACSGSAAVAALRALESYRGRVYLEDAFGEARWIAITKVAWTRQGTAADPRRAATIEYAEVSCGLPTVTT